jgi:hypothetical protein
MMAQGINFVKKKRNADSSIKKYFEKLPVKAGLLLV